MALPLIPLALGAAALLLLTAQKSGASQYSQAPPDGSSPPQPEPKPASKGWQEMPESLQEQVASALGALGVSPATGQLTGGPVTADAIKLATQTAALCESQGFYDIATQLRGYIAQAAPHVATPPDAAPIAAVAPPGLTPDQMTAIARTLTLDRDPKNIQALLTMLQKLPPSPERDHLIQMAQALLLQLQAAQSTTQTMQQIDQVIKATGVDQVLASVKPLPAVTIPVASPPPVWTETAPPKPAVVPPSMVSPAAAPSALGTRPLKAGMSGPDVKAWQNVLIAEGAKIASDSAFGPATTSATKDFQKRHGLTADGIVGPATRAKIGTPPVATEPSLPQKLPSASVPAPLPTPATPAPTGLTLDKFPDPSPTARVLKTGSKGDDVKSWQRILKAFGYDMGTFGPARDGIDGDFGATADKQTRAFQQWGRDRYKDSRITVDGQVGPITRRLVLMRTAEAKAVVSGRLRRSRSAA